MTENTAMLEHKDDILHQVIADIYAASCDTELWTAVLEKIARLTGSKSAALLYQDYTYPDANIYTTYGIEPSWRALYKTKYKRNDPSIDLVSSVPTGDVVGSHMLEDQDMLYQSETYQDFYLPQNIKHFGGSWLFKNDERSALIGFHREQGTPEYEAEVLAQVKTLVFHLQKSLHIHRVHTQAIRRSHMFEMGLDSLQMGIVFFGHDAQVTYCNQAAKTMLKQHPAIQMQGNQISVFAKKNNDKFKQALKDGMQANTMDVCIEPIAIGVKHPDMETTLPLLISPIHQSDFSQQDIHGSATVVMVMTDPETMLFASPELLSTLYNLTHAEAEVAIQLANAMSAADIAAEKNVKVTTVRTQVQSIFSKMGITTQAQLIKLLLTSPLVSMR